jgi:SAM-dependent methyltransferase
VTGPAGAPAEASSGRRPTRPCPACAYLEHDILYEQRFEQFAAGSITDAYEVVACRACGMCFASGLPDPGRFSEYYGQSSKYDMSAAGAEVSALDAKRYRDEAEFIAAYVADRAGPILDVGTATGDLLLALRDLGFRSVHGVEPSPEAARLAREKHGLDVIAGDAASAKSWNMGFSVVSLVAVLEHLVEPGPAVRELAGLLRPDGLLYVLVPDGSRFRDHVDAPYQEFSVEHINYFTAASLKNLFSSVGLEVVADRATFVKTLDADGPALEVLCQRTTDPPAVDFDWNGVAAMRAYIARSAKKEAAVVTRIAALAEDQTPLYVWGTGTNALHLLAASRLAECNIVAFLDSNPHYTGQRLAGRPVMAPADVENVEGPILVASAVSQTAIATAARKRFGSDVALILMY